MKRIFHLFIEARRNRWNSVSPTTSRSLCSSYRVTMKALEILLGRRQEEAMNTRSGRGTGELRLLGAIALGAALATSAFAQSSQFKITILSSLAATVSGGDMLAQVQVPASTPLSDVLVRLNGRDVTSAFRVVDASTLQGLVPGLQTGANALAVGPRSTGQVLDKILVTNHSISGPVISMPQQQPFVCQTQNFTLPITGGTLGAPLDANCSTPTRVDYVYMSTAGTLKPLQDPSARPADLTQTTSLNGRTVNFIVRVETGTINRAIYQIAILHDPKVDPQPDPWTSPAGWNGRLAYTFGGGCSAGYRQGTGTQGVLSDSPIRSVGLANGFAMAASSLNVFGTNCDDVLSAETMMMVKEHFTKSFGAPAYTIGLGESGGSMAQHLIAYNYPGLMDGILPGRSFPDVVTWEIPYLDCDLMIHAFDNLTTLPWSVAQKTAVAGHRTFAFCTSNLSWARHVRPNSQSCNSSIPPALLYNPVTNPGGTRCTLTDDTINVYGVDPNTGFARRYIDNVGVQYGLLAYNSGAISADQFLELNRVIGGYDIDGNYTPARHAADPTALATVYKSGRLNSGKGLTIPIIDNRQYLDVTGSVHDQVRSLVMRARLIAANGRADNQVLITHSTNTPMNVALPGFFLQMDRWLSNIKSDTAPAASAADKVARNKPADLVDACYDAAFVKITDPAVCQQLYPPSLEPRLVAGEPITNDFIKCALKPVNAADYVPPLTSAQFSQLQAIFAGGVCDYSKPPIGKQPAIGTWLNYPSPGTYYQLLRN